MLKLRANNHLDCHNNLQDVYKRQDEGSQAGCYAGLKRRQLFFNEQYKRDIQQQQITRQDWRDNHEKGSSPFMINIFQR